MNKIKYALIAVIIAVPISLVTLYQLTVYDQICARFGSVYKVFHSPHGGPYVELRAKADPLFSWPRPMDQRAGCVVLRGPFGEIGDWKALDSFNGLPKTGDQLEWRDGEVWLSSTVGLGFSI